MALPVQCPPQLSRAAGLAISLELAGQQALIVGRRQLIGLGVPRWVIQAEVRAGRWRRTGRQSLAVHNGPLDVEARRWVAVMEVSQRAAVDGVTALQHAGCDLDDDVIWVIVPKGSRPARPKGVRVKESRRYLPADIVQAGLPRVRPAVAAVHAALWARTDREASYLLLLVIQRRLATPEAVAEVVGRIRRHPRRRLLLELVPDIGAGVQSVGELDVARDLRSRGLPEPDRQVVRRRASGREYLDCRFTAYGICLEIDGVGHEDPLQQLSDLVRDIRTTAEGDQPIRLPLRTYRLDREQVLDALEELFRARGWSGGRAA